MSELSEERWITVETKLAHFEVAIEELQDVVFKQQAAIALLEKALRVVRERAEAERGAAPVGPGNDKPPHY